MPVNEGKFFVLVAIGIKPKNQSFCHSDSSLRPLNPRPHQSAFKDSASRGNAVLPRRSCPSCSIAGKTSPPVLVGANSVIDGMSPSAPACARSVCCVNTQNDVLAGYLMIR